jgi:prepilin-type N-terminal cleavage/methylation domain-containing protein
MKNQSGFTLIELAIVITILGILAIVIIPKYQDLTSDAKKAANNGVLGGLKSSVYIYYAKHTGRFPDPTVAGANGIGSSADSILNEIPSGWAFTAGANAADSARFINSGSTDTIWYKVASSKAVFRTSGSNW